MRTVPTTLLRALCALLLVLGLAAPATSQAKTKKLPAGFFGTVLDPAITEPALVDEKGLATQFGRMHANGVESVRVTFNWAKIEPNKGRYDWQLADRVVQSALTKHVALVPIVMFTPTWAARKSKKYLGTNAPPAKYSSYAGFMSALVKRYGPKGSFFRTHSAPKTPIRRWQIWNEPMQPYYWQTAGKWWTTYGPMLKAAHAAVHKADKKAVVVTAGLSGSNAGPSWDDLAHIYQTAGRKAFDAVAINQYTNAEGSKYTTGKATSVKSSVDHLFQVGYFVRRAMNRYKDSKSKPIYFTEFGWPAALGHLKKGSYRGLESSVKGSAKRMTSFIARLAANSKVPSPDGIKGHYLHARKLGIARAYWYTWASSHSTKFSQSPFQFSGLNQWTPGKPFKATPLLTAFRKNAKKY
jgi:hypothetical protein